MVSSNYSEKELKEIVREQNIKVRKQRLKAINLAVEYLMAAQQQKICDFINSGKMDVNDDYFWEKI